MERRLFQLPIEKKMYLFDNIDLISSTSLGVVSALIEVIDGIEAGLVIATCGRAEACHSSLLVPYRLYKHILLSLPSQPTRCEYLSFLLQGFSIFDTEMGKNCSPEEVKDCIQDVAQQTKVFFFSLLSFPSLLYSVQFLMVHLSC